MCRLLGHWLLILRCRPNLSLHTFRPLSDETRNGFSLFSGLKTYCILTVIKMFMILKHTNFATGSYIFHTSHQPIAEGMFFYSTAVTSIRRRILVTTACLFTVQVRPPWHIEWTHHVICGCHMSWLYLEILVVSLLLLLCLWPRALFHNSNSVSIHSKWHSLLTSFTLHTTLVAKKYKVEGLETLSVWMLDISC